MVNHLKSYELATGPNFQYHLFILRNERLTHVVLTNHIYIYLMVNHL